MKLLLTSSGVSNDSIRRVLVDLLGKPIDQAKAVCVPSAVYAMTDGGTYAWEELRELGGLGWRGFGVLELTALPSIEEEHWVPSVEASDAILVGGGSPPFLGYWMQESGFAERLPELLEEKVYLGVSAGQHGVEPDSQRGPRQARENGCVLRRRIRGGRAEGRR